MNSMYKIMSIYMIVLCMHYMAVRFVLQVYEYPGIYL